MVSKLEYPLSVFELQEGAIYKKYRTANQHGHKLYKRIGNELFEAADMYSEWKHNFSIAVKDRFKQVITPKQVHY